MKTFKIYGKVDEYIVLKCPYCGKVFRAKPYEKVFGKERKNAKCQKCEKLFDINENQLEEDPLPRVWGSKSNRKMIMIKPSGEQEFFKKKEESDIPGLSSADNLD